MFGRDHNQLSKVVELCKDLSATMPTMNPRVVVEEAVTTTVARARVLIVREEVHLQDKGEFLPRHSGSQEDHSIPDRS